MSSRSARATIVPPCLKEKPKLGPGEMARWLRALATLPEVQSSVPETHVGMRLRAHNCL